MKIRKFITMLPCRIGRHKPNWAQICTRCYRPLVAGVFYEPNPVMKRLAKPRPMEILPEEVANGRLLNYYRGQPQLMGRKRNIERDQLIFELLEKHGNKSRVARIVGLSRAAVDKALKRVQLMHSYALDESKGHGKVDSSKQ